MPYGRGYVFSMLAVVAVLALQAEAQSVISAHSGVVHFFEGAVYLADVPLEPRLGKFPTMAQGAELRTAAGRAEVLLTPGVFLRLGEKGAMRLLANDLADTRVEMLAGSAILDSSGPGADPSVTLIYKGWKMRFPQNGVYRFDAEPARLWVLKGAAEVSVAGTAAPVPVEQGMFLPFETVLLPEPSVGVPADALADWDHGRSESISADNAVTAQIDEDAGSRNSLTGMDGFTYFPLIGASTLGLGSLGLGAYGGYGYANPYQPGFNSIYLPGFTYRPLTLGLPASGIRTYLYPPPRRIGISPGIGTTIPGPRVPVLRPAPVRPVVIPRGTVHVGGHR
jgi:hypothetical protein